MNLDVEGPLQRGKQVSLMVPRVELPECSKMKSAVKSPNLLFELNQETVHKKLIEIL